ncbi:MAG: hypothetical protein HGN29_10180 [Asgard group archaeon]|nr:hypothetical protein [Asgard group archaeon]
MKRGLIISYGVLLLVFSLVITTPTKAATDWGVETDERYKFELKNMSLYGQDYSLLFKENTTMEIEFTELLDNGYNYDVYDKDGLSQSNQTLFEDVLVDTTNYVLPIGLPIALPLTIGSISDYLQYYGDFVNATESLILIDELLTNISDYTTNFNMKVNTTLDADYLRLYSYSHADEINATILSGLLTGVDLGDIGSVFVIPTNITDFDMTITLTFNATSGLFKILNLQIRSISWQEGFSDNFNIDIKYALYVPPPPPPTTPTPTEESAFPWGISTMISLAILGGVFFLRRKRNQ